MNFFSISGYWKDNNNTFENLIVYDMDNEPEEGAAFSDDDIFFYGLSENDLKNAIKEKENNALDFVITSFNKLS
jgi:hypothetical protein